MKCESEIKELLTKSARKLTVNDLLTVFLFCSAYFISSQLFFTALDHYFHFDKVARITSFCITFFPPFFYFMHYYSKRASQKLNLIYIAQELDVHVVLAISHDITYTQKA